MEVRVASVILNRYRILEELGEGGFATVYKAYDQQLDRDVALKLVKSVSESTNVERFEREAKLLSQLKHKNIISVLAFHCAEGTPPFIVMEYVSGTTLRNILNASEKIEVQTLYKLLLQLCDGLGYAHKLGLVHRDLSAANIILEESKSNEPVIRIIDFGLSKLFAGDLEPIKTLTETGLLIGNPHYMSPEAIRGSAQDNRSDIYSLGCLLYECLTGKAMVEAENAAHLFYFHERSYPREPVIDKKDPLAEILSAITLRCIQKDPDKRFQSCEEIIETLKTPQATQKLGMWKDLDPWDSPNSSKHKGTAATQAAITTFLAVAGTAALLILALTFSDQLLVFLANTSNNIGGPQFEAPFAQTLAKQKKFTLAKAMLRSSTEIYMKRGETNKALSSSLLVSKLDLEENAPSEFLKDITQTLNIADSLKDAKQKTHVITSDITPLLERGRKHLNITPQLVTVQQQAFSILLENRAVLKRAVLRSAFDSLINGVNAMPSSIKVDKPDLLVNEICSYLNYAKPHLDTTDHGELNGVCYESRLPITLELQLWKCRCDAAKFTGEKRSALWTDYAQRKYMLAGDHSFDTVNKAWEVSKADPRVDDGTLRALRELQANIAILNKDYDAALDFCQKASDHAQRHKHYAFIDAKKLVCYALQNDQVKLKKGTQELMVEVMGGSLTKPGLAGSEYPSDYFDDEKGEEKFFEYAELTSTLVKTHQLDQARYVLQKLQEIVNEKHIKLTEAETSQLKLLSYINTPPDLLNLVDAIVNQK